MSKFIKHVGKIADRKVAVVFREIPGEEHMCLVVYTETLNQNIHDPLIMCIESEPAQRMDNLADALNKNYTRDGKILLQVLHHEGMMKKVQCSQVLMTPAPNQAIRLNELNSIMNEMSKGEDAVKRLAELDASRGLQDPKDIARRMRENQEREVAARNKVSTPSVDGVIGDNDLARQRLAQADKMAAEARGLLAESERLTQEAYGMDSSLNPVKAKAKKTVSKTSKKAAAPLSVSDILAEQAPKKAGRPRKATVTG